VATVVGGRKIIVVCMGFLVRGFSRSGIYMP